MKIAILGYGLQGRAAYDYWHTDSEITVCDANEGLELPTAARGWLGPSYLEGLDQFDLIVRSPSIHPRDIVAANSPEILKKVTTVTNEFFRVCPSRNIIGVTGTKGKGTTSTLIAKMLEADDKRVHLGGNIGTPPLELLKDDIKSDDWVVLELANFQLIDLKYSPHIGVCVMVVPEHLDWHTDNEEYVRAKMQLFAHQTDNDIAVYFAENAASERIASAGKARTIPYYAPPGAVAQDDAINIGNHTICGTDELKLLGRHNWQNVCAAVTAVWQITQNVEALRPVLTSFAGLPHRLEFVREHNGVRYYNDSFGTTPETSMAAIAAFEQPEVVILGGRGKGVPFDKLAEAVSRNGHVAKTLVIGEAQAELVADFKRAGYENYVTTDAQTMPEIVKEVAELAESVSAETHETPVVLLSTGCTSFDMFNNYKDRGERFIQAVQALA